MEAKVIRRFRDASTNKVFEKGTTYKGDKPRILDLQEKGFLQKETKATDGQESQLSGTVSEVVKRVDKSYSGEVLKNLLKEEQDGENRKGVKDHLEELLKEKNNQE